MRTVIFVLVAIVFTMILVMDTAADTTGKEISINETNTCKSYHNDIISYAELNNEWQVSFEVMFNAIVVGQDQQVFGLSAYDCGNRRDFGIGYDGDSTNKFDIALFPFFDDAAKKITFYDFIIEPKIYYQFTFQYKDGKLAGYINKTKKFDTPFSFTDYNDGVVGQGYSIGCMNNNVQTGLDGNMRNIRISNHIEKIDDYSITKPVPETVVQLNVCLNQTTFACETRVCCILETQ